MLMNFYCDSWQSSIALAIVLGVAERIPAIEERRNLLSFKGSPFSMTIIPFLSNSFGLLWWGLVSHGFKVFWLLSSVIKISPMYQHGKAKLNTASHDGKINDKIFYS